MSKPHFMIDIETTGLEPDKDEIMQVAIVQVIRREDGFWHSCGYMGNFIPGCAIFNFYQKIKSTTVPRDEFAKEHMVAMYDKCRLILTGASHGSVRDSILNFFKNNGVSEFPARLMGWNLGMLDIPFLVAHKYLIRGDNISQGDFHHRLYDIRSACKFQADLTGLDEKVMREVAYAAYPELEMPDDVDKHDALHDCYRQIRILNGLIRLAKR